MNSPIIKNENKTVIQFSGDLYFKGSPERYIFALLELSGEQRRNMLGISDKHYAYTKLAKEWRDRILNEIDCMHPLSHKAIVKLEEIYKEMISFDT